MKATALVLLTLAFAGAASGRQAAPALRLATRAPLVVQGRGFHPGERVSVHVQTGARLRTRSTVARSTGAFSLTFAGASIDRCSAASIWAVGRRGDGARLKVPPGPLCAPASSP
jgi:hypothetical protein